MKKSTMKNLFLALFVAVFSLGTTSICNAQSKSEEEATLDFMISAGNQQLPMEYTKGMVNTKIVKEDKYVVYYMVCDEDIFDIGRMESNIPLMRGEILKEINSDNPLLAMLRNACKSAGYGIAYYYVGKTSGKIAKVKIPANELK